MNLLERVETELARKPQTAGALAKKLDIPVDDVRSAIRQGFVQDRIESDPARSGPTFRIHTGRDYGEYRHITGSIK